uniref:Leucine-rich repeat-containing protein 23 n=1 Tax=Mola mola TaxID=94237 RepID=A0A3Q4BD99_MOLML
MSDTDEDIFSDVGLEETLEEDEVKFSILTQETISQGLSLLSQTGNGLGHAFIKLDLNDKQLNDITALSSYVHLRFLDVSNNHITNLSPLASLTHLLWLKVDNNALTSLKGQPFAQLRYLQWLSIAGNHITDPDGLVGPSLERLILSGNDIQKVSGLHSGFFMNLVSLELRGNQLETTDGISLPKLQRLYLAQNVIKRLEGLEKLENLTTLHLRDNELDSLDGLNPNMKSLQYLNVRGNAILDKTALQSLIHVSNTLRALVISENPVVDAADYRVNVLILLPQLERLDKEHVSPEERAEAQDMIKDDNNVFIF